MRTIAKTVLGYTHVVLRSCRKLRGVSDGFLRALIYHDIPPEQHVLFAKQIQAALRYYQFVDPETFLQMYRGELPIRGGNILLTFDDGFHSNRIVAETILNPLGIKALFFVLPELIACEKENQADFIAKYIYKGKLSPAAIPSHQYAMSWEDIKGLIAQGHTIGSHTATHAQLSALSEEALQYELMESAKQLTDKLHYPIRYLAYPFGDINSINHRALQLAKQRYDYVFSGVRGNNINRRNAFVIRRDQVDLSSSLHAFYSILEGSLTPYYYFQQKKLDAMSAYD